MCFMGVTPSNPHNESVRWVILFSSFAEEGAKTGLLNELSKVAGKQQCQDSNPAPALSKPKPHKHQTPIKNRTMPVYILNPLKLQLLFVDFPLIPGLGQHPPVGSFHTCTHTTQNSV